jgi:hypothetical protein
MECETTDPVWLAKAKRGQYFVDLITGMSNGVIMVEDSWIERAHPAVVHGVTTRVLAPEELVASKVFVARRERFDGADIAHVIYGTYRSFDFQRALELVGRALGGAVVVPGAVPRVSRAKWVCPWRDLAELLGRLKRGNSKRIRRRVSRQPGRRQHVRHRYPEWRLPNLLAELRAQRLAELKGAQTSRDVPSPEWTRKSA